MVRRVLLLLVLLASVPELMPAQAPPSDEGAPAVARIVDRMRAHDALQAKELEHYQAVRHYQVRYKGLVSISATMDVEVSYDEGSGKSFRILSQSGSKLLCDKVLRRAVESEREASRDKQSTALSPQNYRFRLTGTDRIDGRPAYILHVDPLRNGKFLYRGTVWVDAADYAVRRIDVEPARNPSFWISSTNIENTNADVDGMWLPQKNRSESKIRVGGTAVLTIDYGTYHIALASQQTQAGGAHPGQVTEGASSQ